MSSRDVSLTNRYLLLFVAALMGFSEAIWGIAGFSDLVVAKFAYAFLLLVPFAVVVFQVIVRHPYGIIHRLLHLPVAIYWGLVFICYALLSVNWSMNTDIQVFSAQNLRFLSNVVVLIGVFTIYPKREIAEIFFNAFLGGVFVLVLWTFFKEGGDVAAIERLGNGEIVHSNSLGKLFGMAAIIAYMKLFFRQSSGHYAATILFLMLGVYLFGLSLAESKTALIAVASVISAVSLFGFRQMAKNLVIRICLVAGFCLALFYGVYKAFSLYEGINTLTGRTDIWESALQFISKQPLFGNGYGAVLAITKGSWILGVPNISQAHNQVVQTLFEFGFFGLFLEVMYYVYFVKFWFMHRKTKVSEVKWLPLALFAFCMLRGITEGSCFLNFNPMLCVVLLFLMCSTNSVSVNKVTQ